MKKGFRHNRELGRRFDALNVFQTHLGAESTSTLRKILHNCINPHSTLKGKTPADATDLFLPLGENKLLSLISLARKFEMKLSWLNRKNKRIKNRKLVGVDSYI